MRVLSWIAWVIAIAWMAAAVIGAFAFQELYGGWSGTQVVLVAALIAAVPALVGWWAYRRSRSQS